MIIKNIANIKIITEICIIINNLMINLYVFNIYVYL